MGAIWTSGILISVDRWFVDSLCLHGVFLIHAFALSGSIRCLAVSLAVLLNADHDRGGRRRFLAAVFVLVLLCLGSSFLVQSFRGLVVVSEHTVLNFWRRQAEEWLDLYVAVGKADFARGLLARRRLGSVRRALSCEMAESVDQESVVLRVLRCLRPRVYLSVRRYYEVVGVADWWRRWRDAEACQVVFYVFDDSIRAEIVALEQLAGAHHLQALVEQDLENQVTVLELKHFRLYLGADGIEGTARLQVR